mmetsp:Transcript_448/g.904  ORF Transcript_448/g.904 Transcript_448/m.904 type:complete len:247 (-) Transcript_448:239-979(-)|eukprot:CAMPEP_0182557254 /NCGR_PEP_ID=MMETSP1324-20130603/1227_1 /TAXON_ID=236786 /ORGANISM="Florenciella sp., Strain RCC1587" /LENGTH=246 /DNA_ID=CAMNT_0024769275 /DNA_START=312 /DNA_END=1052 /DNA_ORIENTATION=+
MVRTSIFFLVAWLATAAGLVPSSSRRAWVKQATAGAASTAAALSTPSWASAAAPAKKGKAASATAAAAPAPAPAPVAPDPADILVSGTVSIFEEEDPEMRRTIAAMRTADRAALYVTVKPGGESSRVSGLMRGNTGVAAGAIRIPIKDLTFPYEFTVTKSNLFPEAVNDFEKLRGEELTVACRLDEDGMASTRGANDLAGVTYVIPKGVAGAGKGVAKVEMKGRPPAVKFLQDEKNKETNEAFKAK